MTRKSKIAMVLAAAGIGAAVLGIAPARAQQADPLLHEQLLDGVRGLFDRIFGGENAAPRAQPAPQPASPAPVAKPVPAPAAPVQYRPAEGAVAAVPPSPAAQAGTKSLHEAVVRGDYEETLKLLEQGTDIEARDAGSGASPLHYAVMKGRMPIVELLIARGADVNSRTRNGTTPLHTAALYARKEVAERLLDKRADINAVSASGATPLALATAARNHPIADMLRVRGAK